MTLKGLDDVARFLVTWCLVGLAHSQITYDCPSTWFAYKDYCYKFELSSPSTYDQAWKKCHEFGAGVLHVDDLQENSFIVRWLQRNDPYNREWFTSGVVYQRFGSNPPLFAWQSTGLPLDNSLTGVWHQAPRYGDEGVIVYTMGQGNLTYGWALGDPYMKRQFACKIHKREAYRIYSGERGDDYGIDPDELETAEFGPVLLAQPKSLVVVKVNGRASQPAVLECVVSSRPVAVYKWYKGNNMDRLLSTDTDTRYNIVNGRLEIRDPIEEKDAGLYVCTAENSIGKVRTEPVEIRFGSLGEFNNVPDAGSIVNAYNGAQLACSQIAYNPAVIYQWMKKKYDTKFIRSQFQDYIFISNNGKLYFSEVTTNDEANYTCIAMLRGKNQYQLATRQPPFRTSLPIPMQVLDQAAKAPWGPVIQDDFIAVFPTPPLRGYDVRMECFAYGSWLTPFHYSWSREDGKPLPPNSRLIDHNRVLYIKQANLEDAGVYRCTASRSGASDSKTVHLELSAKPYFVSPLTNQRADISSQLSWICGARGSPAPVYTWYKNGERLSTDRNKRMVVQNNVLTILDLDKDLHDGMYQCSASNVIGTSLSTAQLKVLSFPPNFDKHPGSPELFSPKTGDVSLPCRPEGAPHPTLTWDKDGRQIQPETDKYEILGNGNLRIFNLGSGDEGTYTCTAANTYGEAKISTVLKITGGATITVPLLDDEVVVNETVFLRCEASFPKGMDTVYEWTFNDHPLDFRDTHFRPIDQPSQGSVGLYIISAQKEHEGRYTCTARTPFNSGATNGYLRVYGPPRQPASIQVVQASVTTTSMQLRWIPVQSPGGTITAHVIQVVNEFEKEPWEDVRTVTVSESLEPVEELVTGRHSTTVEGLHPGTAYRFRVISINTYGRGEPSEPSQFVNTLSAPPNVAPQNIRGGGGSVGVLTIQWDPLHPSEYGGIPVKYRIYWRKTAATTKFDRAWAVVVVDEPTQGEYVQLVGIKNYFLLYDVMVQAFNRLGDGPNSTLTAIYSAEDVPFRNPENVQMETYNSTAILISWTPVPDDRLHVRGKLLGYQVNYWNIEDSPEDFFQFIRFYGQRSEGIVIGLEENVDMVMDVQIFNTAGLGPRSNKFIMETSGYAPLTYPQEVRISSAGPNKVHVWWRGISMTVDEEALSGWAIWIWVASEEFSSARMIDVEEIVFEYTVDDIKPGFVYALRMAGVGGGGYGVKTPTMFFTMEGQIVIDSNFAETIDIFLSTSAIIRASITSICLPLFVLFYLLLHSQLL